DGNGVLAAASLGLLFGNVYVKQKFQLQEFDAVFSNSLEILVFVLIGLVVVIPFTAQFLLKSLLLFLIYLIIRYFSIMFALRGMNFTMKEKLFMSLNVQKGIAVAVVVFSLATFGIEGIETILNLSLVFMLYSIILSSVVLRIAKLFVDGIKENKS
ncbi:MAG: cation:proton antiporter, partial [Nanoarchaeota archaeon]